MQCQCLFQSSSCHHLCQRSPPSGCYHCWCDCPPLPYQPPDHHCHQQQLLVYNSSQAEWRLEIINWPDILKQMAGYLNGCQTNKRMEVISVISKGWRVQCQVYVRNGGPAILDYMWGDHWISLKHLIKSLPKDLFINFIITVFLGILQRG